MLVVIQLFGLSPEAARLDVQVLVGFKLMFKIKLLMVVPLGLGLPKSIRKL